MYGSETAALRRWARATVLAAAVLAAGGCEKPKQPETAKGPALAPPTRDIVFGAGASQAEDPFQAGRAAAEAAKSAVGAAPVKVVIVSECYEDKARKQKVLQGVCAVFDRGFVCGGSTYGSFTQRGVVEPESVAVLAVAGRDIDVSAALQGDMGTAGLTLEKDKAKLEQRLRSAGAALARKLKRPANARLMIVIADAHSPKNGALVAGIRSVVGDGFPITGGSVNKNAGQTFVYFGGRTFQDAVVGLLLCGDFKLGMAGRQAKENAKVIATAREGAAEALANLRKQDARPTAVLTFDCAGRKGKLQDPAEELAAIQDSLGRELTLFGTYNAGEIGPADLADKAPGVLSSGVGWHAMFTAIGW